MSKYSIVSGAAVGHVGHLVMKDGESIACFKHASDALAYAEHREYVDGVNAMCNALSAPDGAVFSAEQIYAANCAVKGALKGVSKGPGTLTPEQIKWAEEHDWWRFSGHCAVVVCDTSGPRNELLTFRNWDELRAWAGY